MSHRIRVLLKFWLPLEEVEYLKPVLGNLENLAHKGWFSDALAQHSSTGLHLELQVIRLPGSRITWLLL